MPKNPDRPPADAIPLSEFFSLEMADPGLRAAQQQAEERLNAAKAAIPPTLGGSRRAYNPRHDSPEIQAADETFQRARRAVADELHNRLRKGEWSAWGREGSPVGPWRLLPADAWPYLTIHGEHRHPMEDFLVITNVVSISAPSQRLFFDNYPVAVPGQQLRYYGVVVARQAEASKRGSPNKVDEELLREMHAMIKAEGVGRHTAARRLVKEGRVPGPTTTDDSKAKRLVVHYDKRFRKFED